jgi:hypothetical protein
MGKIKCVKPEVQKTEEPMIMGDVAAPVTNNDTFIKDPIKVVESTQTNRDTTEPAPMVVGMIAISPDRITNTSDNTPITNVIEDPLNEPMQEDTVATDIRQHPAEETITIYPNPASNYIIVQLAKDEKQTAYLYDESGKLVLMQEFTSDVRIDVSNLTKGAYNLVVNGVMTEAVIRKKILIVR